VIDLEFKIWKIRIYRNFPQDRKPLFHGDPPGGVKQFGIWIGKTNFSIAMWG
jgi:hypothetical protein